MKKRIEEAETSVECCQCAIVANTNVTNYQLDFGKNGGDVGFVECGKSEAFVECCQCENVANTNVTN
jgi:hypothetical protein